MSLVRQKVQKFFQAIGAARIAVVMTVLAAGSLSMLSGCMSEIDTSGSKPPQPVTQADYAKQIQAIQANSKMPQGVKDGLIARVKAQEAGAPPAAAHP